MVRLVDQVELADGRQHPLEPVEMLLDVQAHTGYWVVLARNQGLPPPAGR